MAKILLVDDEKDVLFIFEMFLQEKGFQTEKCDNGKDALDMLAKSNDINLVILDRRMPGIDGPAVLKEIREKKYALPVIMLTGFMGDDPELAGADAVILKPADLSIVLNKVNELLRR